MYMFINLRELTLHVEFDYSQLYSKYFTHTDMSLFQKSFLIFIIKFSSLQYFRLNYFKLKYFM